MKLATKRSTSAGPTYTCVVSYCGPTATAGEADAGVVALYAKLAADINTAAKRKVGENRRCIYNSLINSQKRRPSWARSSITQVVPHNQQEAPGESQML